MNKRDQETIKTVFELIVARKLIVFDAKRKELVEVSGACINGPAIQLTINAEGGDRE